MYCSRSAGSADSALHAVPGILEVSGSQLATKDIQVVDNFGLDLPLMFKVHKIYQLALSS